MFYKLSRNGARMIRWMLKSASTDKSRPILECINIENGIMTTTNGFSVFTWNFRGIDHDHVAGTEDLNTANFLLGLENGIYSMKLYGVVLEYEKRDFSPAKYPSTSSIFKSGIPIVIPSGNVTAQIVFNSELAINCLSAPVDIFNPKIIFEIGDPFGLVIYPHGTLLMGGMANALFMPIRSQNDDGKESAVRVTNYINPDIYTWRLDPKEQP